MMTPYLELRISRVGAILLPTILIIGAVVLGLGITGLFVGLIVSRSNAGIRFSASALAGARAGIQDAQRRIIRNGQWSPVCVSLSSTTNPPYSLTLDNGNSIVDVCVNKSGNQYSVQSLGKTKTQDKKRRLDAVIEINPITNQTRLKSLNEIPF